MAFANAQKITKPAAKAAKPEAPKVEIEGVEIHAALDAVIKSLEAMRDSMADEVKAAAAAHFVSEGCATKKQPVNIRAIEGSASSSVELKKRSTASHLTEADIELLTKHGVPFEEKVLTVGTYVINPKYAAEEELLGKVETALAGVEGIPEDLIMYQEEDKKFVTSAESLPVLFTKNEEVVEELLSVVGVLSLKPTLTNSDIAYAHNLVQKMVERQLKDQKKTEK